ncbi:MAG TPA: Rv3235 family protein [Mycobacteriales bacterium]|nr:Rv3235 family protein [Mycobacteriales bacterium]
MRDGTNIGATVLLLRKAPRLDGPFDDEPGGRSHVATVHGSLALAFAQSTAAALPLRLVPPAGGAPPAHDTVALPAAPLPDPRPVIGPLTHAIAEVLTGLRPPQQLSEVATLEVLTWLERNARWHSPRDAGSLRRPPAPPPRPRVRRVRVCEPRRGVLEVAAAVEVGSRVRAMALRLQVGRQSAFYSAEQGPLRWRCTAVRVG